MGSGRVWVPVVSGPLASFGAGYGAWLAVQGFSPWPAAQRLGQFAALSGWLEGEGLGVADLTVERAQEFVRARRVAGCRSWVSSRSVRLPLEFLRGVGAAPVERAADAVGALGEVLDGYHRYLVDERGLARSTFEQYERVARAFLAGCLADEGPGIGGLRAADVSGFVVRECAKLTVAGAGHLVGALRALLRYLHVAGLIDSPLVWAVPGVADRRDRTLPRGVSAAVVAMLLASCERRRTVGRRDYAILLLLVRLGLRVGEVAAMQLGDVDWRRGEVLIRGKGKRQERLPLPVDVGEALASYLSRRAAGEPSRAVFLKVHAPAGPLGANAICGVMGDACARAGIPRVGAHRLRHTAATGMLRAGASLSEIAQVLRHRELHTTAIYAKVDRNALRALAQPWPAARS